MGDSKGSGERRKANGNLERLKELVDGYKDFSEMLGAPCDGRVSVLASAGAGCVSGLMKKPSVAVADAHFEPKSEFFPHQHGEEEYFLVYSGEFFANISGSEILVKKGETLHISALDVHKLWTEELGCDFIVITIPSSVSFPDVDAALASALPR